MYFKFACRSKIINVLLPLRYPINCAILMCGGILTSICIWSGHASASIICTSFCSHNFRSICPISFFSFPYISFLLNFGAKTIWYWHLYLLWAELLISLFSFIWKTSCILVMRSPNHYYYTGGSSLFKVFRLGIRLAIFVVAPLVLLSLGRTEGLFPRLKTPNKSTAGCSPTVDFAFVMGDLQKLRGRYPYTVLQQQAKRYRGVNLFFSVPCLRG